MSTKKPEISKDVQVLVYAENYSCHALARMLVEANEKIVNPVSFKDIFKLIKSDEGIWVAWQANIAMAFKDEYRRFLKASGKKQASFKDMHEIANNAAMNFLKLLTAYADDDK